MFYCASGLQHRFNCIPKAWICDGTNDCWDGEDELGCTTDNPSHQMQSTSNGFECQYDNIDMVYCTAGRGKNILGRMKCDGRIDCVEGEDEANCELSDN